MHPPRNHLAGETSPYLLSHAGNPVDWYPWGEAAFGRAVEEDKPIFLSVGYSACHWCHVMERESFEDAAIATLLNRDFVSIKVDREERPDVDAIYMQAVQAFTGGHGGWPMSVFLLPDRRPFYAGTYFPPTPSRGMPSFPMVLEHTRRIYRERRDAAGSVAEEVLSRLVPHARLPKPAESIPRDWCATVAEACADEFDRHHGGFGGAPKFPPHGTLSVLLEHHLISGDAAALSMVRVTLDEMARGGMHDLLGGGFARYSVDERWVVPHFEKMLYDTAQLLPTYAAAGRALGRAGYLRVVERAIGWMLREMRLPGGAFAAAQDADSEGEEGKYFAWTPAALAGELGADAGRAARLLEVTPHGSFEHGTSVLRLRAPWDDLPEDDRQFLDESVFPKLLAARMRRIPPQRDDKVITAWNGLAISALARCGALLDRPDWIDAGRAAAAFIETSLVRDGRLQHSWKDSRVSGPGFADDHALFGLGVLDLWEASQDARWLHAALDLADRLVALFWDEDDGGVWFAGHDGERLVARTKELFGNAVPASNGAAAWLFTRLADLCGRADLGGKADRVLRSLAMLARNAPRAVGPEAHAGDLRALGLIQVVVAGDAHDARTAALWEVASREPASCVARVRARPGLPVPAVDGKEAAVPTAWVCVGSRCLMPATEPVTLRSRIGEALRGR